MQTTVSPAAERHLDMASIRQNLAEGRKLAAAGQSSAAAVLWSAFESAVRLSLTELGKKTDRPIWLNDTPGGLTAQAVAYGMIAPDDRDVLLRFLQEYDRAVTGEADEIDSALLQQVGLFAERTLDEIGQH